MEPSYSQAYLLFVSAIAACLEINGIAFKWTKVGKERPDLLGLYYYAITRGGWLAVRETKDWRDIKHAINMSPSVKNPSHAMRCNYARWLDLYEKRYFYGWSVDVDGTPIVALDGHTPPLPPGHAHTKHVRPSEDHVPAIDMDAARKEKHKPSPPGPMYAAYVAYTSKVRGRVVCVGVGWGMQCICEWVYVCVGGCVFMCAWVCVCGCVTSL